MLLKCMKLTTIMVQISRLQERRTPMPHNPTGSPNNHNQSTSSGRSSNYGNVQFHFAVNLPDRCLPFLFSPFSLPFLHFLRLALDDHDADEYSYLEEDTTESNESRSLRPKKPRKPDNLHSSSKASEVFYDLLIFMYLFIY